MNPQTQMQVKADDSSLKTMYADVIQVSNNKETFALSFVSTLPPIGALLGRFAISPGHAKRLFMALQTNLKAYEEKFGKVEPAEEPKKIGFQPPINQE
jgi:hypothetical protein